MTTERSESLRLLIAKHWQISVTLMAGVPTVAKVVYDSIRGPVTLQTWIFFGLVLAILIVIRFPRVAITLTRLILGSPPVPTNPSEIFRGPLPYLEGDNLPGRHADVDHCFLSLQQHRFFVLEGESGCGKTSILNAALLPRAREKFRVVECRVASDPMGKLVASLLQQPHQEASQFTNREDFSNALRSAMSTYATSSGDPHTAKPVLLCIDQFEELFVTVNSELRINFLSVLRDAIQSGQLRLLLSIRSDFRDLLMRLCRAVDSTSQVLDLGAYYTLESFSEAQAIAVLTEMLEPIQEGDPVRMQVHEDFAQELVLELLLPPRDRRLYQDDVKTVLPVELQIVGTMIESVGIENFSVDGLRRLGGKTALTRAYVEEAKHYVWRRTGVSEDEALLVLRKLISPARTKSIRTPEEISKEVNLTATQTQSVLDAFADRFLVNRLPDEAGTLAAQEGQQKHIEARYELMHEHLVRVLVEAPQPILQKARDAEERLHFWRDRTSNLYSLSDKNKYRPAVLGWVRRKFTQPIPLTESVKLWRFATSREDRQMLRRSLRGFSLQLGAFAILCLLLFSGWVVWTRSDSYQIASIVEKAHVDQIAGAEPPTQVVEWIKALIYAKNTNAAFEAAHKIKNTNERSKAFAIMCLELTALDDFEMARAAMNESLSIERFSWDTLHSEAIASLVQHLSPQQLAAMSSDAFVKKIEDERNRTQFIAAIAEGLFRAGKNDRASQVLADSIAAGILIHDSERAFETLSAVTTRLINEKKIQHANDALDIATSVAQGINNKDKRFSALITTAEGYAKVGNSDKAANVLKQALALDPNELKDRDAQSITSVAEDVSRAGKDQLVLDIVHNAQLSYKDDVLAATAAGLSRANQDEKIFPVCDEIKSSGKKIDALVNLAIDSIKNSRLSTARRLLEEASLLLSKPIDVVRAQNPWKAVAMGLLTLNEIEEAKQIGRLYEQNIELSGFMFMGDERIGPLAQIAKKLAEEGKVPEAYEILKDIKLRLDKCHALTAIILAEIKAGHFDNARRLQAELVALHQDDQEPILPDSEEEHLQSYLIDIAVALAGTNKLDDALVIVGGLKRPDDKYRARERIAEELVKLGKTTEAISVIDKSDEARQSRTFANLVEWLLNSDKGNTIASVLPLIAYGDDRSRGSAALAKFYARTGAFRLARYTADSCTSQSDQLSAYTVILNEYAKRRNPKVAARLKADF